MDQNNRTKHRERFNRKWIVDNMEDKEVYYVYALVDRPTKTIGYFGVTSDPRSRRWQHLRDHYYQKRRPSSWRDRFNGRKPEFVILGVFPSRVVAEITERCMIQRFNDAGVGLTNDYKYYHPKQSKQMSIWDDVPFWEIDLDDKETKPMEDEECRPMKNSSKPNC